MMEHATERARSWIITYELPWQGRLKHVTSRDLSA